MIYKVVILGFQTVENFCKQTFFNSSHIFLYVHGSEGVSSFLTAHQHIFGYLVSYNGQKVIKM